MEWKPQKLTRQQMEERRRLGGRLLRRQRWSQAEIARRLGVSRMAVTHSAKQLASTGMRGLQGHTSHGRPAKFSKAQQRTLVRLLKRGARAAGFPTERWTLQRIQKLIHREFRVTYHPNYLARLLAQVHWSPQVPLPRAKERDEELIRAWLVQDWPRIKKSAQNRRRNSLFR